MTADDDKRADNPRSGIRRQQVLAERVVAGMLARDEFSKWLGLEVVLVRPKECTVRAVVRPEMVNGFGVAHGGIVFSIADSALAFASNTHGKVTMSIENSVRYPAPVQVGDVLTATAVCDGEAKRLGFYRVSVTNQDDRVVALFTGTVYRTKGDHNA
jgi:acyl-CoA thioesterase